MRLYITIIGILIFFAINFAQAMTEPKKTLSNPTLEERAQKITSGLRCIVCQNQPLNESNVKLAKDLRLLVRNKLLDGNTDEQVINYIVSRYGDYILLKPPINPYTLILWFGPMVILLIGICAYFRTINRNVISGQRAIDDSVGKTVKLGVDGQVKKHTDNLKESIK